MSKAELLYQLIWTPLGLIVIGGFAVLIIVSLFHREEW
jgi:hypothetical protein